MISPSEILSGIAIAKKLVPALEVLGEGLVPLAASEVSDVKNAAAAVGKAVLDLKLGFEALEASVKAAIQA